MLELAESVLVECLAPKKLNTLDQRDAFHRGNEKMQRSQEIIFAEDFPGDA